MIGSIAGDIIGSIYEIPGGVGQKSKDFELFPLMFGGNDFTDDTVLTIATADVLLNEGYDYATAYRKYARAYPDRGYGGNFKNWARSSKTEPYNSWGNGSAMRVSPVAYAFNTEAEVLAEAENSAKVTHDHPEGIKGAKAIALAVFMARNGATKDEIKKRVTEVTDYDLNRTVDQIRPSYKFHVSCMKSVPEAIICFLDGVDYEDTVRNAVSLGGDTDTQACMAGAIAEAHFGISEDIRSEVESRLTKDLWDIVERFTETYMK